MTLQPLFPFLAQLDQCPPSFAWQPTRAAAFAGIAQFLESNIRAGQPFDLKTVHPNPLWQCFEERMEKSLSCIGVERPATGHVRLHQWYSSGVMLDIGDGLYGFDVVPLRRLYGWEDRFAFTHRLPQLMDALFVTHRHEDHYDADLVRAFMQAGKPVYMPVSIAQTWKPSPCIIPVSDGQQWACGPLFITARTGTHVWREDPEQVPLVVYEVKLPDGSAVVYGGDVDYTKSLSCTPGVPVRALFLPWRAPNAAYEAGDARQTGTLQEAVEMALEKLEPATLFYQHCAELGHMYDGFSASFDMALNLKQNLPVASELMFWGEWMDV